jgi:hypothetical protein
MNNKTKTTVIAALILGAVSLIGAQENSFEGSISTKYTSDYARRGAMLSDEAMQAKVGFAKDLDGVEVFGDFLTNQSTGATGSDTDEFTLGVGTSFMDDLLNAQLGVYNTDHSAALDSSLEGFVSISLNTSLTPTVSFYQDTDESLQTFEGALSYDLDLNVASLTIDGFLGSTDTVTENSQNYTGVSAQLSKDINDDFNIFTDVSISDAEARDHETLWGIGLSASF